MRRIVSCLLGVGAFAVLGTQQHLAAQDVLVPGFSSIPWDRGSIQDGLFDSRRGATVPMSSYSITATKDGKKYSGALIGTSPFDTSLSGTSVNTVVVPLVITIGSTVFDPTAPNSCDNGVAAVTRFNASPLVASTNLTFNGAAVGNTQWVNGFRRAEFWGTIAGSSAYQNTLSFTTGGAVAVSAGSNGTTTGRNCGVLGVVSINWLDGYLRNTVMPFLTTSGIIDPTKFVLFLTSNVVESQGLLPNTRRCCILGYHSATGRPAQTYGIAEWDTSGAFGSSVADASTASHEIAEWMDDPLGNNNTPSWGGVGQVGGCQSNLEVGDPLSGTLMPPYTISGVKYHLQELAFFSWFFNQNGAPSVGAGGKFSSNATFAGPSKACPPGGTN
jgi:hypothetical protein